MDAPTTDGGLRLREPAESLDPRVRRLWRIEIAIATAVILVVAVVVVAVVMVKAEPAVAWIVLPPLAVVALGVAATVVVPALAHRAIRFEVTPLGLAVQGGWIVRSLTVVPHSRIQSVRTTTDPLQRAFGLATIEVRTAGSAVARIPGLDDERVAVLRSDLASMAGTGLAT